MGLIESFCKANNFNYITKASKNFPDVIRSLWGDRARPDTMLMTYEEVYQSFSTVWSCIDEIAKNVAGLPFKINQLKKSKGNETEKTDISDDSRFEAIYKPNEYETRYQFFYSAITHLGISGELFIEVIPSKLLNQVAGLSLKRPSKMDIKADESGIVSFIETINDKEIPYSPDEMVYFRYIHPFKHFRGFPPMQVLQYEAAMGINALKFGNNFFINGAKISGVYAPTDEIRGDQVDNLKQQLKQEYAGVDNAYSMMVLPVDGKYTPIGITQQEMEYLQQLNMVDDRICGVYGVPKIFISKTESQSHANVSDQRKILWQETLIPLCSILQDMFDKFLIPKFTDNEPDIKCEFDLSDVEALHESIDEKQKRAREAWLSGGIRWNEYRQAMGLEPANDDLGDLIIIPVNYIPLQDISMEMATPEKTGMKMLELPSKKKLLTR